MIRKCCYCEKREEQAKYRDVEHYRPKSTYWWLAWTWENLLFSVHRLQSRTQARSVSIGSRGDTHSSPSTTARSRGCHGPRSVRSSGRSHHSIQFRRDKINGKEHWAPYGLTERGRRRTIEVCGLDRPGLLDLYKRHVTDVVRPKLERFETARRAGDAREVFDAWETARRGLLGRERPFRALAYDALNILVPAEARARYRLELPRP